jgi:hypothetical protein
MTSKNNKHHPHQPFNTETFVNWLREHGATFPHLEIRSYSPSQRGVHVVQDIFQHSIVITIPYRLLITDLMGKTECEYGRQAFDPNKLAKFSSLAIIAVVLYIMDTMRQPDHFFTPYYTSLPSDYSNFPVFWSEAQLTNWLCGSPIIQDIRDRCESMRQDFNEICRVVPGFQDEYEFEDFLKIRSAVGSRNFGIQVNEQKRTSMVPLADMLNHFRPRQTSWTFDAHRNAFTVTTLTSLYSGQALLDSYGRKSNSRFLLHYGFTLEENREEGLCQNELVVELSLLSSSSLVTNTTTTSTTTTTSNTMIHNMTTTTSTTTTTNNKLTADTNDNTTTAIITNLDPHEPLRRAILGISSKQQSFRITMNREDKGTRDALTFARVAVATKRELNLWINCHSSGKLPKFVSIRNELAALQFIANIMKMCLNNYKLSYEQHIKILQTNTIDYPLFSARRCALILITGEQQIAEFWIRLYDIIHRCNISSDGKKHYQSNNKEENEEKNVEHDQYDDEFDDHLPFASLSISKHGELLTKLVSLPRETLGDLDVWRYASWLASMIVETEDGCINVNDSD